MAIGIDVSSDVGPLAKTIKAAGVDFVMRYYRRPLSTYPALSASEAVLLAKEGLKIGAIWEAASTTAGYFTSISGLDDSTSAYHQATKIGQPAASAIYFAVDFDAQNTEIQGPILAYFNGVASGFGTAGGIYKVGVYGSGAVCAALAQAGLADYTWLANARDWSGYAALKNSCNILQGLTPISGLAFDHDSNVANGDFGGFSVPGTTNIV